MNIVNSVEERLILKELVIKHYLDLSYELVSGFKQIDELK